MKVGGVNPKIRVLMYGILNPTYLHLAFLGRNLPRVSKGLLYAVLVRSGFLGSGF